MSILIVLFVLLSMGLLAGTLLVCGVLWRLVAAQWRQMSPRNRRRAGVGYAIAAVYLGVGIALSASHPWGPHSYLYVLAAYAGITMFVTLGSAALQARHDLRRARQRRSARPPRL